MLEQVVARWGLGLAQVVAAGVQARDDELAVRVGGQRGAVGVGRTICGGVLPAGELAVSDLGNLGPVVVQQHELGVGKLLGVVLAIDLGRVELIGEHEDLVLRGVARGALSGLVGVVGVLQVDVVRVAGLAGDGRAQQLGGVLHDDLAGGADAIDGLQVVAGDGQGTVLARGDGEAAGNVGPGVCVITVLQVDLGVAVVLEAGAQHVVEHVLVRLVVGVVAGQGANQLERHVRADLPVGGLAPRAVAVLHALVYRGNVVLLCDGDAALVCHLEQGGVHGVALARRGGVHDQPIARRKLNGGGVFGNRGARLRQVLGGHFGRRFGHVGIVVVRAQDVGNVKRGGAVRKDVGAVLAHVKARVALQLGQQRVAIHAVAPLGVAQGHPCGLLRAGEHLVGVIAVARVVLHGGGICPGGHGEPHDERQDAADQLA